MRIFIISTFLLSLSITAQTGTLEIIHDLPSALKEISAAEIIPGTDIIWGIEDQSNDDHLYGFDLYSGKWVRDLNVKRASNVDWEELTSDAEGNLYIGDFGNNRKERKHFTIYKVSNAMDAKEEVVAESIEFTLPKPHKKNDFEGFFLWQDFFYIFSKTKKTGVVLKVPNKLGKHLAQVVTTFHLKGDETRITAADIRPDGSKVVLLNHGQIWVLSNFPEDQFFSGNIERISLNHTSQKEGICFLNDNTLIITDERTGTTGGNIYQFKLSDEKK